MKNNTFCKAIKCPFSGDFYLGERSICTLHRSKLGKVLLGNEERGFGKCGYFSGDKDIFFMVPSRSELQIAAALAKSKYRRSKVSAIKQLFRREKKIA